MTVIIPFFPKSIKNLIAENDNHDKVEELQNKMDTFKQSGGSFDNWKEPWKLPSEFYKGSQLKQEYIREIKRYYPRIGQEYIEEVAEQQGAPVPTDLDGEYEMFKQHVIANAKIQTQNSQHRYRNLEGLVSEISGYSSWGTEFRGFNTVEKLIDGFINGEQMAMPLRLGGVQISGNTRLDIAYMMGVPVKMVVV